MRRENGGAFDCGRLLGLVERIESKKQIADDVRGDLGNIYQEAEDIGLNRRALKEAIRLKAMEDDKRSDYLRSLRDYCEALGIFDQGDLFGGDAGESIGAIVHRLHPQNGAGIKRPRGRPRKNGGDQPGAGA